MAGNIIRAEARYKNTKEPWVEITEIAKFFIDI